MWIDRPREKLAPATGAFYGIGLPELTVVATLLRVGRLSDVFETLALRQLSFRQSRRITGLLATTALLAVAAPTGGEQRPASYARRADRKNALQKNASCGLRRGRGLVLVHKKSVDDGRNKKEAPRRHGMLREKRLRLTVRENHGTRPGRLHETNENPIRTYRAA